MLKLNRPLTKDNVDHISKHVYKTTGYSKLDHILNPYWEAAAKALPYVDNHLKLVNYS
jgi:hypothetical protein